MRTLEEMRSRFSSGFSSSDKAKIEELYLLVCGKRVRNTGCGDCYRDAFIEVRTKLKQLKAMPKKPNYILKAGVIIHPQGTSKYYSLNNIPDDVAEEWLGQFPADITSFETYPQDWESRVLARKEGKVFIPTYDDLKGEVEKLNAELAQKETEAEALQAELTAAKEAAGKAVSTEEVEKLNAAIAEKDAVLAEKELAISERDAKLAALEEAKKKEIEEAVAAAKKEVTEAMTKATAETKKELLAAKDAIAQKETEIEKLKAELAAATKQEEKPEAEKK